MKLESALKRYQALDVELRALDEVATSILNTSGVGQAPPVYHRTVDKMLKLKEKQGPLWDEIKNKVIPGDGFHSFWMKIHWSPGTLAPEFAEIQRVLREQK